MRYFWLVCFVFSGCGKLLVSKADQERIDTKLQLARIDLDRDELEEAEKKAQEAYDLNPENLEAAQLLSNIYLAQGEVSLLDIAGRIATDLNTPTDQNNTQAGDVFGSLSDLVKISDEDFSNLGTLNQSTNSFFTGIDVYYPSVPGLVTNVDSPRYKVKSLRYLNKAINVLCPFVSNQVTDSSADTRDSCSKVTTAIKTGSAQVHFTYAMAHFLEALVFNSVINYSNPTTATPPNNLLRRVSTIQSTKFTVENAASYAQAVTELKTATDKILDVSSTNTMLSELMQNINTTVAALGAIENFPPSMISKIKGVLTTLETAISKAGKVENNIGGQTQALKDQFLTKVTGTLGKSIDSFVKSIPADQRAAQQSKIDEVCKSYNDLADSFVTSISLSTPTGC